MLALGKLLDLTLAGREPTEKIQLTADGTRLHWLAEGALEVTPIGARDNGVDLLLSAGIHGNETAPIELLERLIRKVAAGTLKPAARVLFLFGNPEAIRRGERRRTGHEPPVQRSPRGGQWQRGLPCRRAGAPGPGVLQQDRASPPALRPAYRDPRLEDRAVRPLPLGRGPPAFPQRTGPPARRRHRGGAVAEQAGHHLQRLHLRPPAPRPLPWNWARHVRSERTRRSTWSAWSGAWSC